MKTFAPFSTARCAINFRETQIVADAQTEVKFAVRERREFVAGGEAFVLFNWRGREEMRFAIFRRDFAAGIDGDLRVVNGDAFAFRDSATIASERLFAISRSAGTAPSFQAVACSRITDIA